MSDTATNATPIPTNQPAPQQGTDWLAIQAQAPDKSMADIYAMGVDPSTTTLQDKNFYKQSAKIQSMFKQPDGQFNEKAFDAFYNNAAISLNEYQKQNFSLGDVTTDLWNDTSLARSLGVPTVKNPVKVSMTSSDPFTNLKTAQKSFFGLNEIGKWTQPKKSIGEVAEGQKVLDGATGKELDYTPEDTGLFNLFGFFDDPLVLSQYDEDVKDDKGRVIHKRGEMKLDAQGLPRYETLAGRDVAGRQMLSRWNTLTKEDSFANKIDFMDSDDIQKSVTGSLVKGAVELLPLALGGPVSTAYRAYYIASNLLDATAQIGKSVDAILDDNAKSGNFYKFANSLQGWFGQQKTGMSEYGGQNMFSIENLANQAVDAIMMMTSQNAVFSYPQKIRQFQMAKALGAAEGSPLKALLLSPSAEDEIGSAVMDFDKYMLAHKNEVAAGEALLKNVKELEAYGKYSGYMATAYMSATMATGITQAAKQAGLNDRDTGMLYLGYMGALSGFFRLGVARWVEEGMKIDEVAKDMNDKLQEYGGKYLPSEITELNAKMANPTDKGRGLQLLAAGRNLGKRVADFYKNDISFARTKGITTAAIAGGLEMGGLEALKTSVQGIYNSLQSYGLVSTKSDARFDLNANDVIGGIGSSMFGGAFGGAIFHVLEKAEHQPNTQQDLVSYVLNGFGSKLVDNTLAMQRNGQLGSKTLSITPLKDEGGAILGWAPVNKDNPISHNDFIADRMIKTIRSIDEMRKAYQVDPNKAIEAKDKMYQAIVDTSTDTDLRDRIHATFTELYNTSLDLSKLPQIENEEATTAVNDYRTKIAGLSETLLHLQGDKSLDEFFRQGLFNIRTDINSAFGVKTRGDFAKKVNPMAKSFEGLSTEDKAKAEAMFQEYKQLDGPAGMKWDLIEGKKDYDVKMMNLVDSGHLNRLDLYKQSLEALPQYVELVRNTYHDALGTPVSVMYDRALQDDFLTKLKSIKYVPDVVYDDIQRYLTTMQSEGASSYLQVLGNDVDALRMASHENLRVSLNTLKNRWVEGYLRKRLGDKQYDELLASDEMKDVKDNGKSSSDYSLLKVIKGFTNSSENQADVDLRIARATVDNMLEEDAEELTRNVEDPNAEVAMEYPELVNYMGRNGVAEYLKELAAEQLYLDDLYDATSPKTVLKGILLANHIEKLVGSKMSSADKLDFIQEPSIEHNLPLGLTVDGKFHAGATTLLTNTLQHLNTEPLDEAVSASKEFDAQRVSSPLAEMMEATTNFIADQYKEYNEGKVASKEGESNAGANYLNASQEFADQLDSHINQVNRVAAVLESTVSVNPLVNDFRINNPAGLADDAKGERLYVMSSGDASYLQSELNIMRNKLQHLKEVNEYNKNNVLAKLLRDSGLDLASKYQTLKNVAANVDVVKLMPSLQNIFNLKSVDEYSNTYKTASDELRNQALYEMAKFEHDLYNDFQKLSTPNKDVVINSSFKPIDTANIKFYESADGGKPYNEYAQTLYLAKTFGTSTMDFYNRFAGEFDSETKLFKNLDSLKHVPFSNQESSIRMSFLLSKGDPQIIDRLFNAYTTPFKENGEYDFSKPVEATFKTTSGQVVWGDPGTGKTTAVLLNSINLLDKGSKDVLLLAPEQSQVDKLVATVADNGYEDRIDNVNSRMFRDFMKSLNLTVKGTLKPYDFDQHDDGRLLLSDGNGREKFKAMIDKLFSGDKESLDILKDGKLDSSSFTFNDALASLLGRYKLIAVDEYTHINPLDIAILHKLVDKWNESSAVRNDPSKRVYILSMGDNNQLGYLVDGLSRNLTNVSEMITAQPLTTTLRSGWDVVNNTLTDLRNRAIKYNHMSPVDLVKTETAQESLQIPIKASYVEGGESGSLGIKVINKLEATREGDLSFITSMRDKMAGTDLIYVVNNEDRRGEAEAMLRSTLGDNWHLFARVATPKQVQGGEYKYAIIDASPNITEGWPNGAAAFNLRRVHSFLNTMLSRATEATLYLKDSTTDPYVKFESAPVAKAIRQLKLDDETKAKIKADKQSLMAQILQDYTPKEQVGPAPESVPAKEASQVISVKPIKTYAPLFESPKTEVSVFRGKSTDMMSYNSYSTKKDFDTIFKMRFPDAMASSIDSDATQAAISRVINSYKYYLLHANRDGVGDAQIQLRGEFENLFDSHNLDWENPSYYIEIAKRGNEGLNAGRTELTSDYPSDPNQIVVNLKLRLNDRDDTAKGIDLNMGFLSSIEALSTKQAKDPSKDTRADFFSSIRKWINANGQGDSIIAKPTTGESSELNSERVWRSGYFTAEEWSKVADVYGSQIMYEGGKQIRFQDFRKNYFDFTVSDPQVIVANLIDDNNKSILDPDDRNSGYNDAESLWNVLKGKVVAFASDVYELNSKSAKDLLNIYIRQLGYFNTPEFQQMDDVSKRKYIEEIEDEIPTDSGASVKYRPNLVKLIKLDNPRTGFLDFRERFLQVVRQKTFMAKITPELFRRFDTSLYVKDRIVKSLVTLKKMLDSSQANREWFQGNVLDQWNKVSDDYVENLYRNIEQEWNNGEKLDRTAVQIDPIGLETRGLAPMSMNLFRQKLDELLDPTSENGIYRGKYETTNVDRKGRVKDNNVKVYGADINPEITPKDLDIKLSGDKLKDFAGSLIDVNMFNLLKNTRNANFAGTIDLALKALGGLSGNSELRKYDLSNIFKDGLIESVVIAGQPDDPESRATNVLADAFSFGGDFTFTMNKLTHPYYSIKFDQLMNKLEGRKIAEPETIELKAPIADSTGVDEQSVAEPAPEVSTTEEPKQAKLIELDDPTGRTSEGNAPLTVRTKVTETMETGFNHDSDVATISIEPLTSTLDKATYQVTTSDGSNYEVEYNMNDDSVKVTPLNIKGDEKTVLQQIDKQAMKSYKQMIEEKFGEDKDPLLKQALDNLERAFRHTMLTSNMTSMNSKFSLPEYDAEMGKYRQDVEYGDYEDLINNNFDAFREYASRLGQVSDYITDYTPKVC